LAFPQARRPSEKVMSGQYIIHKSFVTGWKTTTQTSSLILYLVDAHLSDRCVTLASSESLSTHLGNHTMKMLSLPSYGRWCQCHSSWQVAWYPERPDCIVAMEGTSDIEQARDCEKGTYILSLTKHFMLTTPSARHSSCVVQANSTCHMRVWQFSRLEISCTNSKRQTLHSGMS
jgi:hypothetical protein